MSHWEKVASAVDNLDLLKTACEELGAVCKMNSIARGYSRAGQNTSYGKDKMSDMVVTIPNCEYDLSVNLNKETGIYEVEGEWMGGQLERFFGKEGCKLGKVMEMYSVHKAEDICRKQRKTFERVVHDTHIDVEVFV